MGRKWVEQAHVIQFNNFCLTNTIQPELIVVFFSIILLTTSERTDGENEEIIIGI